MSDVIASKVLVFDACPDAQAQLKAFFEANNIIGVTCELENLADVLEINMDLGAVFISEDSGVDSTDGVSLGQRLNKIRPELPLFLRVKDQHNHPELNNGLFAGVYQLNELERSKALLDKHLFCRHYPVELIRGIQEFTENAIHSLIHNVDIETPPPYLVKDKYIYGELLSLIPLESEWCRGYMLHETTQEELKKLIINGRTFIKDDFVGFRQVNEVINELTNLIWGGLKARFFKPLSGEVDIVTKTQVPVIVNHLEKFVCFGSSEPQLCFQYRVTSSDGLITFTLYQKLIFNLNWQPEAFEENYKSTNEQVESGELEFF